MAKAREYWKTLKQAPEKLVASALNKSQEIHEFYNLNPKTGEHLPSKQALWNNRYRLASFGLSIAWKGGILGSVIIALTDAETYQNMQNWLKAITISTCAIGTGYFSMHYAKTQSLQEKVRWKELGKGFAWGNLIDAIYCIKTTTSIGKKTIEEVDKRYTQACEATYDPLCQRTLAATNRISPKTAGLLENLAVASSSIF